MWDKEADIVIVGYGGAGASAAIVAHDLGMKVTVIEKMDKGGGNTRLAGGTIREYLNVERAVEYYEAILPSDVSRDMIEAFVRECAKTSEWLRRIGGELERAEEGRFPPAPHVIWPHLKGAEGVGGRWLVKGESKIGGENLWALLAENVAKRRIEVLYNTSASYLVAEDKRGEREVKGVVVKTGSREIRIKAGRAVILSCGGFQFNEKMHTTYLGFKYCAQGNLGNTGDGILMAQEIGADLWHMNAVSCGLGYKFPEYPMGIGIGPKGPGYIYVDQAGNRFMDEGGVDVHAMAFAVSWVDFKNLSYPRIPAYLIFDESVRRSGPIIARHPGAIIDHYKWSEDNEAEIKKGWIKASHTIRDLAVQIGIDPKALQRTIATYNLYCLSLYDPDFGRSEETLKPIVNPPFYGVEVWPCLMNTQGGPRRNAKGQVIDVRGKVIKRLYSAGELGSMWGIFYPGAGNISEALTFGRIVAENAAKETPLEG